MQISIMAIYWAYPLIRKYQQEKQDLMVVMNQDLVFWKIHLQKKVGYPYSMDNW